MIKLNKPNDSFVVEKKVFGIVFRRNIEKISQIMELKIFFKTSSEAGGFYQLNVVLPDASEIFIAARTERSDVEIIAEDIRNYLS